MSFTRGKIPPFRIPGTMAWTPLKRSIISSMRPAASCRKDSGISPPEIMNNPGYHCNPRTAEDILNAADTYQALVNHTPVLNIQAINRQLDAKIFFKCENFQKVGAFKARARTNAFFYCLEESRPKRRGHPLVRQPCPGAVVGSRC